MFRFVEKDKQCMFIGYIGETCRTICNKQEMITKLTSEYYDTRIKHNSALLCSIAIIF